MKELSTERAIEALYTIRAYYASLTAGYPKGKDCRGIGDVMCSEIANSCLMAIKALEQQPNLQPTCNQLATDYISRQAVIDRINKLIEVEKKQGTDDWGYGRERVNAYEAMLHFVKSEYLYPSVEPEGKKGLWLKRTDKTKKLYGWYQCSQCLAIIGEPTNYCSECGSYNGGTE